MDSDPNSRVDLFICCHGSEKLSPHFTTLELASKTKQAVCRRAEDNGTEPFVFIRNKKSRSEVADAVLQTRSGGLALFLLTPEFFSNQLCVAELQAFLDMCSDSKVRLKLRYVGLESSEENILSIPAVKRQVPTLSEYGRWKDIDMTTIQETAENLTNVVFDAWECTDSVISPHELPTVLGRTRNVSYCVLQQVFTEDYLPSFNARLSLPINAANMQDAFRIAREHGEVSEHNVKNLYNVIIFRRSPTAEKQRRMVQAYECKWVESKLLGWGDGLRRDLLRRIENNQIGSSRPSSSERPQKRLRKTEVDVHETAATDAIRPQDVFRPYFDEPKQFGNVALDFTSCDEACNPVTAEGRLRLKVFELLHDNCSLHVSASGKQIGASHGMGGVGKTTALRALCYDEKLRQAYIHGICYLEFGQDADDKKVIEQVARCVYIFGGEKKSEEIEKSSSLSDVLEKGARWIREKTILLVCDDLWPSKGKEFGYLLDLTVLLRYAPKSRLLISTRDRNIADNAGESVEFAPLEPEGVKARQILLAEAPGIVNVANICDKTTDDCIQRILRICAGLPLALAIAAQGLKTSVRDGTSISHGFLQFCNLLEQDRKCVTVEGLGYYPGLARVIKSSLKHCQEWGMSDLVEERHERRFDMTSMFKSLCVLDKQMSMPKRVLSHVWGTDDASTDAVMSKFADSNLAKRVATGPSPEDEFGLRLHDLVLERCQQMARNERTECHKRIVDAYKAKLVGDKNDDEVAWGCTKDDGYILSHLSRHLVSSEQAPELKLLLCDIRWTMHQIKVGGWMSLKSDFEHLFQVDKCAESGMKKLLQVLKEIVPYARVKHEELPFQVFARLSPKEREEEHVPSLLSSIDRHFPKPWLRPANRYIAVRDSREEWKEVFPAAVHDLIVDWKKGTSIFATSTEIVKWCMSGRRLLWAIPYKAYTIAISEDGKIIVSGSNDKTIRRWDAHRGTQIGDPLIGYTRCVNCIAISEDGKIIVSGSGDGTIRRWDAQHGTQIGDPLIGHTSWVDCIAISEDGKIIVSGSDHKTIRRWDTHAQPIENSSATSQNSSSAFGAFLCSAPANGVCIAMKPERNVFVFRLDDNVVAICVLQT